MVNEFATARTKMVEHQIRTVDVTSRPVLAAFAEVPREAFVPAELKKIAYLDDDLQVAPAREGMPARYTMEAAPLAQLLQLAEIDADDVVLEIGCNTGYGTAILSRIAGSVVALECDPALAEQASATLSELGYDNAAVVVGDLAAGYPEEGPYDVIVFAGAAEVVPQAILDQLRDGGRLIVAEGTGVAARASLYLREGDSFSRRQTFNCAVKLLPGLERKREFVF